MAYTSLITCFTSLNNFKKNYKEVKYINLLHKIQYYLFNYKELNYLLKQKTC